MGTHHFVNIFCMCICNMCVCMFTCVGTLICVCIHVGCLKAFSIYLFHLVEAGSLAIGLQATVDPVWPICGVLGI